jgi:Stage II sporulation protein E (SpoIIE)
VQGSHNPARPRHSLILCTDGLVEVFDSRDDILGVEGFARLVLDSAKLPLREMRQAVLGGVAMPRHGPLADDGPSSSSKFASSVGVVSVCKRLDFLRRIKTANHTPIG